ncbi:MAG: metal-dependent hydrolase [Candidatus Bathyarchaeia archaeon]
MARITWYGHAAFKVELADRTLFLDPMLDQNPTSPVKSSDIAEVDAVYVTHDHSDHLGDAFAICKRTGALFAAVYELAEYAAQNGVPNIARLNVGGSISIDGVKLTVVQAIHSASRGVPTGVVIEGEGVTVYHAGDTALFGDMRRLGERYRIDLACIPIGGNYTMDAEEAVEAVALLRPRMVFPMHFGTFPVLARSATEFAGRVKARMPNVRVLALKPGETYDLGSQSVSVSVQGL